MSAHTINERLAALLFVAAFLLVGCAGDGRYSRVSSSTLPAVSIADRSARIEEHFDRLDAQVARVERLQRRVAHNTLMPQLSSRDLRSDFAGIRQAERQQRAIFIAYGIAPDADYYRLQHRLLDGFSAQLRQLEELLTRMSNDRNA